jgi:hypothetical protein
MQNSLYSPKLIDIVIPEKYVENIFKLKYLFIIMEPQNHDLR